MKISTVSIEKILGSYVPYQKDMIEIENIKNQFSQKVNEIRSEMESIANQSKLLVLDTSIEKKNQLRLRELQGEGMKLESEFRMMISQKQESILDKNFNEISELINVWADNNNVDMVINSNSVLFSRKSLDVTEEISSMLKLKDLWSEIPEFNESLGS